MFVIIRIWSERAMLESTGSAGSYAGGQLVNIDEFSRSCVQRFVSLNKDFGTMGHAIKVMFYDTN